MDKYLKILSFHPMLEYFPSSLIFAPIYSPLKSKGLVKILSGEFETLKFLDQGISQYTKSTMLERFQTF